MLPGVDYFQVVFTLPDRLSALALGNRRPIYNLLFRAAWQALRQVIEAEQGFEPAAVMVLHTWNQKLDAHAHVHALVPGGGPALREDGIWKRSSPPPHENQRRRWLVDADVLRREFRRLFLDGLRRLHRQGTLRLTGEWSSLQDVAAFEEWLQPLESVSWVTYIQPPPKNSVSADQVLKYLARYMTGGPISSRRLVAHEDGQVIFRARTGTTTGGSRETENVTLPGAEFVRRWALHILPKGYTKTRRFGGFSNRHCRDYMARCSQLLSISNDDREDSPLSLSDDPVAPNACPHCGQPMLCIRHTDRPGWWNVLTSSRRPEWYDDG